METSELEKLRYPNGKFAPPAAAGERGQRLLLRGGASALALPNILQVRQSGS